MYMERQINIYIQIIRPIFKYLKIGSIQLYLSPIRLEIGSIHLNIGSIQLHLSLIN